MPAEHDDQAEKIRTIVASCLAGETRAATELVDRFRQQVLASPIACLGSAEDAEDVTQGPLSPRTAQPAAVGTKRGILCRGCWRLPATAAARSWPPGRGGQGSPASATTCPTRLLRQRRYARWPKKWSWHCAAFAQEYRQAFVLFHEQELSYSEIAQALGCPVGTVKTWVHRHGAN